jgi:hypothetical protein
MAMLRHHAHGDPAARLPARLLYSARTWDDVIYRDELARLGERADTQVIYTLTRERPAEWSGFARRIDRAMLEQVAWTPAEMPRIYICGPTRSWSRCRRCSWRWDTTRASCAPSDSDQPAEGRLMDRDTRLDGNAAAGALREVFARDVTAAMATCAGCGSTRAVGALIDYGQSMGVILRCPGCDAVMLRVAHTSSRLSVDASGVSLMVWT